MSFSLRSSSVRFTNENSSCEGLEEGEGERERERKERGRREEDAMTTA